jgi:hypothetical protein
MRSELREQDVIESGSTKNAKEVCKESREDRGSRVDDRSSSKRPREAGQPADPDLESVKDDPRIDSRGVKHVRRRGVHITLFLLISTLMLMITTLGKSKANVGISVDIISFFWLSLSFIDFYLNPY